MHDDRQEVRVYGQFYVNRNDDTCQVNSARLRCPMKHRDEPREHVGRWHSDANRRTAAMNSGGLYGVDNERFDDSVAQTHR